MSKKYYPEIDLLRGIAITFVIIGHSIIVFPIDLHEIFWCRVIFEWVSVVHMPLFFFISGFCYSNHNNYKIYIKKKAKRLIIPYLFFNIIDMFSRQIFPEFVNKNISVDERLYQILVSGGGYWFLYVLFLIYLFYPLIEKLFEKHILWSGLILILIVVYQFSGVSIEIFLIDSIIKYLFYFITGYLLRKYEFIYENLKKISRNYIMAILSGLIWITVSILISVGYKLNPLVNIAAPFFAMLPCFTFVFLIAGRKNFFLKEASKYSLQLYLFNGYWLVLSRIIIIKLLNIDHAFSIICFNILVCLFVSLLIIKFVVDKIKLLKILCGVI